MKTIKSITLLLALLFISSLQASNPVNKECGNLTLDEELNQLLQSPEVSVNKDTMALVKLVANDFGELVVLSVTTVDEAVELYVKDRLNYRKLCNSLQKGEIYSLPVTVRKN